MSVGREKGHHIPWYRAPGWQHRGVVTTAIRDQDRVASIAERSFELGVRDTVKAIDATSQGSSFRKQNINTSLFSLHLISTVAPSKARAEQGRGAGQFGQVRGRNFSQILTCLQLVSHLLLPAWQLRYCVSSHSAWCLSLILLAACEHKQCLSRDSSSSSTYHSFISRYQALEKKNKV